MNDFEPLCRTCSFDVVAPPDAMFAYVVDMRVQKGTEVVFLHGIQNEPLAIWIFLLFLMSSMFSWHLRFMGAATYALPSQKRKRKANPHTPFFSACRFLSFSMQRTLLAQRIEFFVNILVTTLPPHAPTTVYVRHEKDFFSLLGCEKHASPWSFWVPLLRQQVRDYGGKLGNARTRVKMEPSKKMGGNLHVLG
jgi:hypothetical protein